MIKNKDNKYFVVIREHHLDWGTETKVIFIYKTKDLAELKSTKLNKISALSKEFNFDLEEKVCKSLKFKLGDDYKHNKKYYPAKVEWSKKMMTDYKLVDDDLDEYKYQYSVIEVIGE